MTFQANVRSTFFWRSINAKASILALGTTFFTSLAITSESSPILAYLLLFNMAILVAVVVYMTTSPAVNLYRGTRWYRVAEIWRPITFGLIVVLATLIVLFTFIGFPLAEGSVGQKLRDVLFWAITVGFIEELVRWTWLQTLPYSPIVANLVWVLLHPQVAVVLQGQTPNYFFVVSSFLFGLFATGIMFLYESPLPYGFNRWLGPVMAATLHAGLNATVVIWKIQIAVPAVGDTLFKPMASPIVFAIGISLILSSAAVILPRRPRARGRGAECARVGAGEHGAVEPTE